LTISFPKISAAAFVVASLTLATSARADLVISFGATTNVACGSGTCTATAKNAVLNVSTLKTMLASGNITVSTGSIADRLVIRAPLSWTSKSTLSLHAQQQILVKAMVIVRGFGGMALSTGDGSGLGNLAYAAPGRIAFEHPLSRLSINGLTYKLVTNIAQLAAAASANANAYVALANNYDATSDGIYSSAPVPTFNGLFEGLGNTISNLNVSIALSGNNAGLFGSVSKGCDRCGRVNGVALVGVSVAQGNITGGLVGVLNAAVSQSSVSGVVTSGEGTIGGLVGSASKNSVIVLSHTDASVIGTGENVVGGLVGENKGLIQQAYALGNLRTHRDTTVGGLVGLNEGVIKESFESGNVTAQGFTSMVGGLVGRSSGAIRNCYSTGAVNNIDSRSRLGGYNDYGGFAGRADTAIIASYSTGTINEQTDRLEIVGGFVGFDGSGGMKADYWDLTTSGVSQTSAGAGNVKSDPGITGLTKDQLSAKLPAGFLPAVWAINPKTNGGLPYLIANPPPS
jgi:hypothetical protein